MPHPIPSASQKRYLHKAPKAKSTRKSTKCTLEPRTPHEAKRKGKEKETDYECVVLFANKITGMQNLFNYWIIVLIVKSTMICGIDLYVKL